MDMTLLQRAVEETRQLEGRHGPHMQGAASLAARLGRAGSVDGLKEILRLGEPYLLGGYVEAASLPYDIAVEQLLVTYLARWREHNAIMVSFVLGMANVHRSEALFDSVAAVYVGAFRVDRGRSSLIIDPALTAMLHGGSGRTSRAWNELLRVEPHYIEPKLMALLRAEKDVHRRREIVMYLAWRRYAPVEDAVLAELPAVPPDIAGLYASEALELRTERTLNAIAGKLVEIGNTPVPKAAEISAAPKPVSYSYVGERPPDRPPDSAELAAKVSRRAAGLQDLLRVIEAGPPEVTLDRTIWAEGRLAGFSDAEKADVRAGLAAREKRESMAKATHGGHPCEFIRSSDAITVKTLIQRGHDVNAPCVDGAWPVQVAASRGKEYLVLVLSAGASANQQSPNGATALSSLAGGASSASGWGNVESIRKLLAAGADPNLTDSLRRTSLHNAIGARSLAVVKILVEAVANVNAECLDGERRDGLTPLQLALDLDDRDIAAYLEAHGARTNRSFAARRLADKVIGSVLAPFYVIIHLGGGGR